MLDKIKNNIMKKKCKALHEAMINELTKDDDGNQVLDADFYHQTMVLEFGEDVRDGQISYKPEIYRKKAEKSNEAKRYSNQSNNTQKHVVDEDITGLYNRHLEGDLDASRLLHKEPRYYDVFKD